MAKAEGEGVITTEYTPSKKEAKFLTEKQRKLPANLKRSIIESKQSGAGYSGTEDYKQ